MMLLENETLFLSIETNNIWKQNKEPGFPATVKKINTCISIPNPGKNRTTTSKIIVPAELLQNQKEGGYSSKLNYRGTKYLIKFLRAMLS